MTSTTDLVCRELGRALAWQFGTADALQDAEHHALAGAADEDQRQEVRRLLQRVWDGFEGASEERDALVASLGQATASPVDGATGRLS